MLTITPIPALSDNYIWAIQKGNDVVIVDPSEAFPVLAFITNNQLNLTAILLTHNHHDHTGGIPELASRYPELPIYGPQEVAQFANNIVYPEDHLTLFGYDVRIIESAGHTAQHVSFLFGHEYLFCGDALFSAGCGRVFTGDYQAQFNTLQRFKALPELVEIYPAHEYTLSNLKFAEAVLSPSCRFGDIQKQAETLRTKNKPTLPTTLARELQINPFLQAVDLAQFIALRQQKDNF